MLSPKKIYPALAAAFVLSCSTGPEVREDERRLVENDAVQPEVVADDDAVAPEVAQARAALEEQVVALAVIQPLPQAPVVQPYEEMLLRNQHSDPQSRINSANVANLEYAWGYKTNMPVSHRPLYREGKIWAADWGGNVFCLDAKTGDAIWTKQVQETVMKKWPWHGFTGTGVLVGDLLVEASTEGIAYGLDPDTGEVKWQTRIAEDEHAGNIGKIAHYDGMIYIGLASVEEMLDKKVEGFEPDFQGSVVALDADTGEIVWRKWLAKAPDNGVGVWSSFGVDTETGVLYFTTSNNYTGQANENSDAMFAVNAKNGETYWKDQTTQHDVWTKENPKGPDYSFGAGPQLFEAEIDGEVRKLVGAGQKSGVFWVWDRLTGERVWHVNVGYGQIGGGIHGEASVGQNQIFIWGNNSFAYKNPEQHPMDIKAVNASNGDLIWVNPKAQPALQVSAGFLANDVYFVGALDGQVRAYRATDGEKLWTSGAHGPLASSLWIEDGMLTWASGVPKQFGGSSGPYGVFAYAL